MNFFARLRPAPPATDRFEIATEVGPVTVALRRHRRARNYTLRLAGPGHSPVLTLPARGSLREARAFLDRHVGWLASQMRKLPQARPIEHGATIPLRGAAHRVHHAGTSRGAVRIEPDADGARLVVAGAPEHLRRRVVDFLKKEAKRDLEPAVLRYAARLGVTVTGIKVRDQRSRWGSCSASGQLSFSWRLILAPPFVLDYLAAHEVAHLKEMNHSRRFWRLCELLCPDTKKARDWLAAHGAGLHAIGAG